MSNIMKMKNKSLVEITELLSVISEYIEKLDDYLYIDPEFDNLKNDLSNAYYDVYSFIDIEQCKLVEKSKWKTISKKLGHKNVEGVFTKDELSELMSIVGCRANNE